MIFLQNLVTTEHISFILVFFEGLLSFFSPCVLPLIPIYISYLAGSGERDETGAPIYRRGKVFLHTVCFVLGISFAFFLLGIGFTAAGSFFSSHRTMIARIGGILIFLLGLSQVGLFDLHFLQREHKIHLNLANRTVNPLVAFAMGFTFSFAWTPCVGPALSSVLILASGAKSALIGNLLVFIYALGFVLPFLALGLFTTQVLTFLKKNQTLMKYTIKAGGVLLILIGFMTVTGWMNGITGYLSAPKLPESSASTQSETASAVTPESAAPNTAASETASAAESTPELLPAPDFTLKDQNGTTHTLSDYKGKVVFLNFWATWCPPCQRELADIETLYQEYGMNEKDVVILGLVMPKTDANPYPRETVPEDVRKYIAEKEFTFPSVFDETGEMGKLYGIHSFPTTYMIDTAGNVFGYMSGAMSKDMMVSIITQTQSGKR